MGTLSEEAQQVSVVLLPLPAQGHLNQLLHLALRITAYGIPVHYVGSVSHNQQARDRAHSRDATSDANLKFHDISIPLFPTPPPNPYSTNKFPSHLQPAFDSALGLGPHLLSLLQSLSSVSRRVIFIHDSTMAFAVPAATSLPNVTAFSFHSVSALSVLFFHWQSRGRAPDRALLTLPDISLSDCFSDEFLAFIHRNHSSTVNDSGRLLNTCRAIEAQFIDSLALEPSWQGQKIFAIGPLNPIAVVDGKTRHDCLKWLDRQPANSVVYVSFGTTTTLPKEQILELARGLESSGHRFLWVLREADRSDIYAAKSDAVTREAVVDGVEKGMVLGGWAPQLDVLAHGAVGGFLTHCGWNSCMESMSMGVPMLAWPMHSDQPRNTLLVTEVLKVGIVVRDWAKRGEVLPASEIRDSIARLMVDGGDGTEIRRKARRVGEAIREAMSADGTSTEDMDSFISYITS